jgi:hypothetical protein
MKTESKLEGNKEETKIKDKNIENKDEKDKNNQNNNKNVNIDDPDFDINTFCPDPENADKKIRSKTVRESVKKGKLKQFIEEEKSNKIDPKKYLKTPQVMVPRLRPQKGKLNPTPLKLSSISLKGSRLNSIAEEESQVQSEREEESENMDSSSSSFFDDDEKNEEEEKNDKNDKNDIIHEVEEDKEEEKEEEKEEVKEETKEEKEEEPKEEKDENEDGNKGKENKIEEKEPCNDILGMLKKNEIKKEEDKNEEKAHEENIFEENDEIPLMEMRKNMRKERKSFWKKKVDTFDVMDSNIKNNFKKFKEDVFEEKNNNDDIENKENLETTEKCCPILDFYAQNSSLKKNSVI